MENTKENGGKDSFLTKLQSKWKLKSIFQVVLVLIVFALTGLTTVTVKVWIYNFFNLSDNMSLIGRIGFFILITLPTYQTLLLLYGFVFGQFSFFWQKEKLMLARIKSAFSKN
ncbi:DUF6787 family protein [Fulvivirgaceae bacterium LMO-SS25]